MHCRSSPSWSRSASGPPDHWLLARDVVTWSAVALTVYSGFGYLALALAEAPAHRAPSSHPMTPTSEVSWTGLNRLVLGVVQGLSEFLPISSERPPEHVTSNGPSKYWTGRGSFGEADKIFFDVMLHVGTLLAIVVHYRSATIDGAKGLLGSAKVPRQVRVAWRSSGSACWRSSRPCR